MPRYVRVRFDIVSQGVPGTSEILLDTRTHRYVSIDRAPPVSERHGFDGTRVWGTDASGFATAETAPDSIANYLQLAALFSGSGLQPSVAPIASRRYVLRWRGRSRGMIVALDGRRRVAEAVQYNGPDAVRTFFRRYGRIGGVVVPTQIETRSAGGTWRGIVRTVEAPRAVTDSAFALPRPPRDADLDGVTTIPIDLRTDEIVVTIRLNDGPPLRMLFDTGANLSLTPKAARRVGLRLVGHGFTGGPGIGDVPERYATVRHVRIGRAVLHDLPCEVFDLGPVDDVDGLIGIEVLLRYAVRIDLSRRVLSLARDARLLYSRGVSMPLMLSNAQPVVDGGVDRLRGRMLIDTGSSWYVDVMSPAVRRYGLVERYRARRPRQSAELGGPLVEYQARAREVRLGPLAFANVPIQLAASTKGAFAETAVLGNVGFELLRACTMVFDVQRSRFWVDCKRMRRSR
ncbi:MAG: aspartyl protease family protein [Candidatus Eremiobacteraeota bacterium]|nr:aspartyl protease family protein [Candidatus Eremiobacteraeota bacterium]